MDSQSDQNNLNSGSHYYHLRILVLILKSLSCLPLPVLHCTGIAIGELAFWLIRSRRKITIRNLTVCYPDLPQKKIIRIARKHFHHMLIGVFTMSIAWWASPKRFKRLITFKNRNKLEEALNTKSNLIILAPHFTSLEFLGKSMFAEMPMTSMYQRNKNPFIDDFILQRRRRFGTKLYDSKSALTALVKSIRSGVPFYYLPDQDPGKTRGVFAPFFDIPTATFPTLSKLSKLGNASVLPCMARVRKMGLGIDIIFEDPLEPYPTGDMTIDADIMNKAIENLIKHAPEQYYWSHKRFKSRPDGEPPFYQ